MFRPCFVHGLYSPMPEADAMAGGFAFRLWICIDDRVARRTTGTAVSEHAWFSYVCVCLSDQRQYFVPAIKLILSDFCPVANYYYDFVIIIVGRNLWICTIHGSRCAIYDYGMDPSRHSSRRNP